MSEIITPRLVTESVVRLDRDLIRRAFLKHKNWNPAPLSTAENLELLQLEYRIRAKLDEKIRLEEMRKKGCHEL